MSPHLPHGMTGHMTSHSTKWKIRDCFFCTWLGESASWLTTELFESLRGIAKIGWNNYEHGTLLDDRNHLRNVIRVQDPSGQRGPYLNDVRIRLFYSLPLVLFIYNIERVFPPSFTPHPLSTASIHSSTSREG